MNWPRVAVTFSGTLVALTLSACGVKGDPLPPEKPPEIGRGRPTYKRAAEKLDIKSGEEENDERE